ncbi:sensor histidine kinase [Actinoalloteichus caeruleus]|uniref:sensor histidine kinase n=1 Tax=Actinoalloteichus cyanogriseus TaxID=2893586 RepID=UPI003AB01332
MSIGTEPHGDWDHRVGTAFAVLPYVLLAVSTSAALAQRDTPVQIPGVLGVTLAAALWLACFDANPRWWENPTPARVHYAGLTVLAAVLVVLAPWYGIFAFIGYVHAFERLDRHWRYLGAATTSMIMSVSYQGGAHNVLTGDWWEWAVTSLVSVVLAGSCYSLLDTAERRGRERTRALVESHEANARLEAALEENADLHAQLLARAREAGVLDERQRMAREIHDTLAQGLAGIVTQLQAAEQTLDQPSTAGRHLTKAMSLARESLTEARRTVHAMEPELLADARLPEAIAAVVHRWCETHDVDAVLTTTGDARPMHTDVEVALVRTAQEALANVAKHAGASRVGLTLSYLPDRVLLDVRDDGVGFDVTSPRANGSPGGGFGLAGMRQRVRRLAGRLDIEAEPGGGTAISASVPAIPATGGTR